MIFTVFVVIVIYHPL